MQSICDFYWIGEIMQKHQRDLLSKPETQFIKNAKGQWKLQDVGVTWIVSCMETTGFLCHVLNMF